MQPFLTAPERALRRRREPVRLVPKPECAKGKAGGAGPGAPWAPLLAARLPLQPCRSSCVVSVGTRSTLDTGGGGHGRRYTRTNGKVFQFLNAKCESAFLSKRNPGQINWTVLYRRKHKKRTEEIQKKRPRRAVRFLRAITGASLADRMAKRNQKPEVRKVNENKLSGLPRKQKRLSKRLKRQHWLLLGLPQRLRLSKASKPVKVSAPCVGHPQHCSEVGEAPTTAAVLTSREPGFWLSSSPSVGAR
ncbi:hypothetical protein QTO34_013148 [Cnephaeus nilssonii]|uniref:Large ribosomal subunit protein eL24 n=1 Tax=Cnephaeus nilssonii TaxID=3371016 RepID=A0AA40I7F3_CNENI|nr:hypothetical protein QTO34_013148 [Eptesicus nilssonii]